MLKTIKELFNLTSTITYSQHLATKAGRTRTNYPPYLNQDILPVPYIIREANKGPEKAELNNIFRVGEKENKAFVENIIETYRNKNISSIYDGSKPEVPQRMFSGSCSGKPPKYREPCKRLCDDDDDKDEFKRTEEEDKCKQACQEWKAKKGIVTPKSICADLKCLKDKAASTTMPKGQVYHNSPPTSAADCLPVRKEDRCPTDPPPYRYKDIDPNSYLDLPKIKPKKKFSEPCGLVPLAKDHGSHGSTGCKLVPKQKAKKKGLKKKKVDKGINKGSCSSTKCTPVKIKCKT